MPLARGDFATYNGLNLGPRLQLVPQFTPTSLILTAVQGGSGQWGIDNSGNASVPGNWIGAIPNGIGDVATFGTIITQSRTVTIDVPAVYGGMVFNDADRYIIAGSQTLELNATGKSATIQVLNASIEGHLISAPLRLSDDLDISNNSGDSGGPLVLSGPLDNTLGKKITVGGSGGVTFSGPQNHGAGAALEVLGGDNAGLVNLDSDGGLNLAIANNGMLNINADNSILQITGTGMTAVASDQTLQATLIVQDSLSIAAGGMVIIAPIAGGPLAGLGSVSAVPEPSTWAMLMLAVMGLGIYRHRSR